MPPGFLHIGVHVVTTSPLYLICWLPCHLQVLRFEGGIERLWGSWADAAAAERFKRRLDLYGSIWCCINAHPGHIWCVLGGWPGASCGSQNESSQLCLLATGSRLRLVGFVPCPLVAGMTSSLTRYHIMTGTTAL